MKITQLTIANFKALEYFEIPEIRDFVMIAGPNGSGKSCIFDSVRLLKSVYGGYAPNEYHQWFSELAINIQDPASLRSLFRDRSEPITITAHIEFDRDELEFVRESAQRLVQPLVFLELTGQPVDYWAFTRVSHLQLLQLRNPEYQLRIEQLSKELIEATQRPVHAIGLEITPDGELRTLPSVMASATFQAYDPRRLGLIEYHGASRVFARQSIGGVNLDERALEDQSRQQNLYNWQQKYQNIKTELASHYVRKLIAGKSDHESVDFTLEDTLKELFTTFIPDKEYLGIQATAGGGLRFPVRLANGEEHDIDELSSGEKEIVFGFLKLRNSTPPHSVILMDEPELHLNPRLLHGFTDFFYRRVAKDLGSQIFLGTHSDTLLQQAVGNPNYQLIHLVPADPSRSRENQAVPINANDEVERVIVRLVGDLASYRPRAKVVFLEGEPVDGFDVTVVQRLFPHASRNLNFVGATNKTNVRGVHLELQRAARDANLPNRFFAILDSDGEFACQEDIDNGIFKWNVYHIENYLLDTSAIRDAVAILSLDGSRPEPDAIEAGLLSAAVSVADLMVKRRLHSILNRNLMECLRVGGSYQDGDDELARTMLESVRSSAQRVREVDSALSDEAISELLKSIRTDVDASISNGLWREVFPGREILSRFVHEHFSGAIDYVLFRNVILDRMVDGNRTPPGMQLVIQAILGA